MATATTQELETLDSLRAQLAMLKKTRPRDKDKKEAKEIEVRQLTEKIESLEKEETKAKVIKTFPVGAFVVKKNQRNILGVVNKVDSPNNSVTILVHWEGDPYNQRAPMVLEPCDHTVLDVIDKDQCEFKWVEDQGYIRSFDGSPCSNLFILRSLFKDTNDEEKQEWITEQYNGIAHDIFPSDTKVKYDETDRIVSQVDVDIDIDVAKDPEGAFVFVWLKVEGDEKNEDGVLAEQLYTQSFTEQAKEPKTDDERATGWGKLERGEIADLTLDKALQQRAKYDNGAINEYSRITEKLPPIKVFLTPEGGRLVVDGFHSVRANTIAGNTTILQEVREGTYEEALKCSFTVNRDRGVRLTNEDIAKSVNNAITAREEGRLLNEKGKPMSNRQLATLIKVSFQTVNNYVKKRKEPLEEKKASTSSTDKNQARSKTDNKNQPEEPESPKKDTTSFESNPDFNQADPWDNSTSHEEDQEQENPATERPDVPFTENCLVRIKGSAASKALLGRQGQYAIVRGIGQNEDYLDLQAHDGEQIVGISKAEVSLITAPVKVGVTLTPDRLVRIMEKFGTIDKALTHVMGW